MRGGGNGAIDERPWAASLRLSGSTCPAGRHFHSNRNRPPELERNVVAGPDPVVLAMTDCGRGGPSYAAPFAGDLRQHCRDMSSA